MAQDAIFGPFFATILLTFVVWIYMYARRISFLTSNAIDRRIWPCRARSPRYEIPVCAERTHFQGARA